MSQGCLVSQIRWWWWKRRWNSVGGFFINYFSFTLKLLILWFEASNSKVTFLALVFIELMYISFQKSSWCTIIIYCSTWWKMVMPFSMIFTFVWFKLVKEKKPQATQSTSKFIYFISWPSSPTITFPSHILFTKTRSKWFACHMLLPQQYHCQICNPT